MYTFEETLEAVVTRRIRRISWLVTVLILGVASVGLLLDGFWPWYDGLLQSMSSWAQFTLILLTTVFLWPIAVLVYVAVFFWAYYFLYEHYKNIMTADVRERYERAINRASMRLHGIRAPKNGTYNKNDSEPGESKNIEP